MSVKDKFTINYENVHQIDLQCIKSQFKPCSDDEELQYNPFNISNIQNYIPTYDLFFNMNPSNYNEISLNKKRTFIDLHHVYDDKNIIEKNVFIKYTNNNYVLSHFSFRLV